MNDRWIGLKRVAVFGAAFGSGAVVALAVIGGGIYWYQTRPATWRAKALVGVSAETSQTFQGNTAQDFKPAGFAIDFVIENKTGQDYALSENFKLFKRDRKSKSLEEFAGKLDHPYSVPAKERATVPLWVNYSCSSFDADGRESERDVRTCFKDFSAGIEGFVGFDNTSMLRVDLPAPTLAQGQEAKADTRGAHGKLLPPDKGDVFDKVASCQEADRLVTACTRANLNGLKPWASYGGFSTPLPELASPPSGYKLDPSDSVCPVAVEWKNYCAKKVH